MAERRAWTDEERLAAFELYCRTPVEKLTRGNPDVAGLAWHLGRSPATVVARCRAFDGCDQPDPAAPKAGRSAERDLLAAFRNDPEQAVLRMAAARARADWLRTDAEASETDDLSSSSRDGPTEPTRPARIRLVQRFFRAAVLAGYGGRCCICGLSRTRLLTASHIVPWNEDELRRADPANGLCLCAMHERAFDRHLLGVDARFRVVLASSLRPADDDPVHRRMFTRFDGRPIRLPSRFHPDPESLARHRARIG